MKYDAKYFIKFFSKIPENKWTTGSLKKKDCRCALGWLGVDGAWAHTPKSRALVQLFEPGAPEDAFEVVWRVNDSETALGKHPKTRILNKLRQIAGLKMKGAALL